MAFLLAVINSTQQVHCAETRAEPLHIVWPLGLQLLFGFAKLNFTSELQFANDSGKLAKPRKLEKSEKEVRRREILLSFIIGILRVAGAEANQKQQPAGCWPGSTRDESAMAAAGPFEWQRECAKKRRASSRPGASHFPRAKVIHDSACAADDY